MRQSVKIIDQVLCIFRDKNFLNETEGFVKIDDNKISSTFRSFAKFSMEGTIHHFKIYSEGFSIKYNSVYAAVEAPKGEFGVSVFADGSNRPYRCRIRAPGFFHLQGIDFMSAHHLLSDIVTVLGTQDIVFGEVDR